MRWFSAPQIQYVVDEIGCVLFGQRFSRELIRVIAEGQAGKPGCALDVI
jgi:hypothetical protein